VIRADISPSHFDHDPESLFRARSGASQDEIREDLTRRFSYNLSRTVDQIRPGYQWDVSCHCSVPEAIVAFLDPSDFEDAIRLAVSPGGDAEAFYRRLPEAIVAAVQERMPPTFIEIVDAFREAYSLDTTR
jgi:hypothetical protein